MIINHLQIISPYFTCGIGEKNSPRKSNDLQGDVVIAEREGSRNKFYWHTGRTDRPYSLVKLLKPTQCTSKYKSHA